MDILDVLDRMACDLIQFQEIFKKSQQVFEQCKEDLEHLYYIQEMLQNQEDDGK